jgi:hypothetical protein
MNATYTLTEGNDALNRVLLMMRYDLNKTLVENVVLEQMPDPEDMKEKPEYGGKIQKISQKTFPAKEMSFDEFMEKFRETLTSTGMIALEAFLTSTGVGSVAVITAYSSLLIYDLYKGIVKGEWGWLNIVFDIISVITSGTLVPMLKNVKSVGITSIEGLLSFLKRNKVWGQISPYLFKISNWIPKLINWVKSALTWLIEKTGYTKLKKIGPKIISTLEKIGESISNFLAKDAPKATIKQGVKNAAVAGSLDYSLKKGIEYGISKYTTEKDKKIIDDLESGTDETDKKSILRDNPNLFKTIKSYSVVKNSDGSFKNFKINGVDYVWKPNSEGFVLIPLNDFKKISSSSPITDYDKTWDYKKVRDEFYFKRKSDKTNKWVLSKGDDKDSIKNKVFKLT